MRQSVRMVALVLLGLAGMAGAVAAGQGLRGNAGENEPRRPDESARPIEIRTSVSRTAVWVGDRVVWTVQLRCAPDVDILLDDLLKERLQVEGGDLLTAEPERIDKDGRITHRIRYTLVTYRVDAPAIKVAAVPVRYYARSRGQRPGDAAPAGEVTIPPLVVAVRSTVPESDEAIHLRPPAEAVPGPTYLRLAQPVGLALVLVALVPAAVLSLGLARRARGIRSAYRARRGRKRQRGSFDQIKSLDPASEAERVEAFGQLDAFVREHLSLTTGIGAHALPPPDMRRVLDDRLPGIPHDDVEALLATCERVRYGPEPPSAAEWADAVRDAEGVLGASRR